MQTTVKKSGLQNTFIPKVLFIAHRRWVTTKIHWIPFSFSKLHMSCDFINLTNKKMLLSSNSNRVRILSPGFKCYTCLRVIRIRSTIELLWNEMWLNSYWKKVNPLNWSISNWFRSNEFSFLLFVKHLIKFIFFACF